MSARVVSGGLVRRVIIERESETLVLDGITQFRFETNNEALVDVTTFGDPGRSYVGGRQTYTVEFTATAIRYYNQPTFITNANVKVVYADEPKEQKPQEATVRKIRFNDGGGDDRGGEGSTR